MPHAGLPLSFRLVPVQGFAGCSPSPQQLAAALQQHDLFLYFGHGGGEQYVPLAALKRLERCAGALLMGCSSGRLREAGLYEVAGPIWGYMMAGELRRRAAPLLPHTQ